MRWAYALGLSCALLLLALATSPAMAEAIQATSTPTEVCYPWPVCLTPTATFENYFSTSTPFFDMNNTCPTALPSGWGTVTPGLLWEAQCGNCLLQLTPSSTPLPTSTPNPSVTPPATATPQASQTPTYSGPLRYQGANSYPPQFGLVNGSNSSATINILPQHVGRVVGILWSADRLTGNVYPIRLRFNADAFQTMNVNTTITDWQQLGAIANANTWPQELQDDLGMTIADAITAFGIDYAFLGLDAAIHNNTNWPSDQSGGAISTAWQTQTGATNWTIIPFGYIYLEQAEDEPQATFCGSVVGGVEGFPIETGIDLPSVTTGQATCYGLPEVVIPLAWAEDIPVVGDFFEPLNLDDVYFPAFQICFKPLVISNFVLFGMSINVEVILLVLAGATLIRWILRS